MIDVEKQSSEFTSNEANHQQQDTSPSQPNTSQTETNTNHWESISQDFQKLGQSIANAAKDLWQDEKNRDKLDDLCERLENVGQKVNETIDEKINTANSTNIKEELHKAVGEFKEIGGKVYTETKPHLVNALKILDDSIQQVISRLDNVPEDKSASASSPSTASSSTEETREATESKQTV